MIESTVYVITSGLYSDYKVDRVFSTMEKAQEFINANKDEEYSIEEYPIDGPPVPSTFTVYRCIMDQLGNVTTADTLTDTGLEWTLNRASSTRKFFTEPEKAFLGFSTISHEHAMKLTAEARQSLLREHPLAADALRHGYIKNWPTADLPAA